jgi:hypothetical protein
MPFHQMTTKEKSLIINRLGEYSHPFHPPLATGSSRALVRRRAENEENVAVNFLKLFLI